MLTNFDIVAAAGDQTGTMRSVTETSTGDITIDFTHEVENPLINGIEIVQTSPAPPPPTTGDKLLSRHLDTAGNVGATTTVDSGSILPWSQVRGAFIVGGQLYYGLSTGSFYKRTLQRHHASAPPVAIDPYDDPTWQNVQTGSGQTYASIKSDYYTELPNVTSAFYSGGRLYYTLFGQSQMYYRYFTPDSGVDRLAGVHRQRRAGLVRHRRRVRQWQHALLRHQERRRPALHRLVHRPRDRQPDDRRRHPELGRPRTVRDVRLGPALLGVEDPLHDLAGPPGEPQVVVLGLLPLPRRVPDDPGDAVAVAAIAR